MSAASLSGSLSYVLPLKWSAEDDARAPELTAYLSWLRDLTEVIVVDGSPDPLFARHHAAWRTFGTHVRPDPDLSYRNGKVNGVTTGVRLASFDKVVIADDDVRYDQRGLDRVAALLDDAELVRPQNYFDPMPWHARWDTARCLLNRAVARDYPGTFGLRRSTFLAMGGYNGDVLFENLELLRTVRAAGGREISPLNLYVLRQPPSTARFLSQRVRQAYDDFAQPWRLALWLAIVPMTATALVRRKFGQVLMGALGVVAVAEVGRRRAGGRRVYPAITSLCAPFWVLERGICSWIAVHQRIGHGGVRYAESRFATAAHSSWWLRHPKQPLVRLRRAG